MEDDANDLAPEDRKNFEGDASEKTIKLFDVVGLMFKMGANVRNWLERGFALRLDDHMLFYFRSARDFKLFATNQQEHKDRPAGSICVHGAHLYVVDYVEGRENCFELSTEACPKPRRDPAKGTPDARVVRHYYMSCPSREKMRSWLVNLVRAGAVLVSSTERSDLVEAVARAALPASRGELPSVVLGLQGFLEKRGRINTAFKRRFFRLIRRFEDEPLVLEYYDEKDSVKPNGRIELEGAELHEQVESETKTEHFERIWGVESQKRLFVLRAETDEIKHAWLERLRAAIRHPKELVTLVPDPNANARVRPSAAAAPAPAPGPAGERADAAAPRQPQVQPALNGPPIAPASDGAAGAGAAAAAETGAATTAAATAAAAAAAVAVAGLGGDADEQLAIRAAEARRLQERQQAEDQRAREAERALAEARDLLDRGGVLIKHGRTGKPHPRLVFLSGSSLYWSEPEARVASDKRALPLMGVEAVLEGKLTDVLKRTTAAGADAECCFSLRDKARTLDLQAKDRAERDQWVAALRLVMRAMAP